MLFRSRNVKNCAEVTAAAIDDEVRRIIAECHKKALQLLKENESALHKIAAFLLEKETITGEEFMRILKEDRVETVQTEG